jgi:hypothetical protein
MRWLWTCGAAGVVVMSMSASAQQFPPIGPGSVVPIGPSAYSSTVTPPLTPCGNGTVDLSTGWMLGGL